MTTIGVDEMQRDLPGFLRRVQAGETLVVTELDRPVAEITPIRKDFPHLLRPFGLCAGEFSVPDDSDSSLPEDVLRVYEKP